MSPRAASAAWLVTCALGIGSLFGVCCVGGLLGASAAHAQIPTTLVRRRVVEVRVTGETSGATGARDVGIPLGAPLTRRLVRATVQRLLETGRWADVQIDAVPVGTDVALIVYLQPRIEITRVDVIDNEVLSDDAVREALGLPANGALEQRDLASLARAVADAYLERGYDDARITLRLRDTDDPTRKVLRVRVVEGEPVRVLRFAYPLQTPPSDVDLADALGLDEGDVLDRTRLVAGLREARRMLRRAGFLESRLSEPEVQRDGSTATLVVPVRFGPRYELRIMGPEPLERTTVEQVLQLENERLTRRSLAAIDGRVTQLFQRHGFHRADVELRRVRGEREGTAVLEVRCTPGRQLAVLGTSFPGATHFERDYLRDQVLSVLEEELPDNRLFAPVDSDTADRIGLGGRSVVPAARQGAAPLEVDPGRVFYAPTYDQAVEHLSEVYQAAGFLSARVGPVRLERVGRGRAVVVIPVFEGPRTLLYGIQLRGNEAIGDRALLERARLTRGEPFSYLGLEEAIGRMLQDYMEHGYLYARIEPDVRFSDDRERAEVVLTVVERFVVRVGAITIEGNERTDVGLVRDVLRFTEGDVYRPSAIRESQDALMGLGVFASVNIAPQDAELPERVKAVTVTLRERDPNHFDFQLGISTGQGARGALEYGYNNLGGYALGTTLRLQFGIQLLFQDDQLRQNISGLSILDRLERRFTLTFVLPRVPEVDNVRTTLDLVHIRDNQRAFGLDKTGAILSFNWRPERWLTLSLSGEFEYNGVQLFGDRTSIREILEEAGGDPQITRLLRVPEGESFVVSTRLRGTVDRRDSPFVPTDGWFSSAAVEWAHTLDLGQLEGSDAFFSHFLKLSGTLNGYVPIGDVVIAGQVRVGGIVHLEPGSQTYPNRQFFLGGVDSLRGLNQDQLQPQDIAELQLSLPPERRSNTVIQGGDFFYLVRVEARFPLFIEGVGIGLFVDLGNHWANPNEIDFSADCVALRNLCFVRPTVGAGLRIATPVGPLALDVGFNLLQREQLNEPLAAFHFSIGVF